MKKSLIILLLCIAFLEASAQKENSIFWGITASADVGRFQDRFEISPLIGFKIMAKIYIGLGSNLSFYSIENTVYSQNVNTYSEFIIKDKIWYSGFDLFVRVIPFEQQEIFLKNIYFQCTIYC